MPHAFDLAITCFRSDRADAGYRRLLLEAGLYAEKSWWSLVIRYSGCITGEHRMRENTLGATRTLPQLLRFVAPSIVMMLAMRLHDNRYPVCLASGEYRCTFIINIVVP